MTGFYMLAGTVSTHKSLTDIQSLLADNYKSEINDDELELDSQVNLTFRSGFDHEFIIVGDSTDSKLLISESEKLSSDLQKLSIQHAFEIYDTDNLKISEIAYNPLN